MFEVWVDALQADGTYWHEQQNVDTMEEAQALEQSFLDDERYDSSEDAYAGINPL
jgi:hypothetical protein